MNINEKLTFDVKMFFELGTQNTEHRTQNNSVTDVGFVGMRFLASNIVEFL